VVRVFARPTNASEPGPSPIPKADPRLDAEHPPAAGGQATHLSFLFL